MRFIKRCERPKTKRNCIARPAAARRRRFHRRPARSGAGPNAAFLRRPASVPGAGLWHRPLAGNAGLADRAEDRRSHTEASAAESAPAGALPDLLAGPHPRTTPPFTRPWSWPSKAGFGPQAGFVNALLRGYLREFDATKRPAGGTESQQPARSAIRIRNGWWHAGKSAGARSRPAS